MQRSHARRLTLAVVAAAGSPAAAEQSVEERAREQAEKMQASMVDVEAIALEQKADAAVVSEVQRNLDRDQRVPGRDQRQARLGDDQRHPGVPAHRRPEGRRHHHRRHAAEARRRGGAGEE